MRTIKAVGQIAPVPDRPERDTRIRASELGTLARMWLVKMPTDARCHAQKLENSVRACNRLRLRRFSLLAWSACLALSLISRKVRRSKVVPAMSMSVASIVSVVRAGGVSNDAHTGQCKAQGTPSPHAGSTGADIATDPATQLHDPSTGFVPILSPEHYKRASRV